MATTIKVPTLNGKKTWLSLLVLAVIGFAGSQGWLTAEQVAQWTDVAQIGFVGSLIHKAEKVLGKKK